MSNNVGCHLSDSNVMQLCRVIHVVYCFTVNQRITMGQTLSEPVTTKHTESCQNQYLKVGSSSMQGWRINMEDSHTHILQLPDDPKAAFFGVYDGHGGNNCFKRIAIINLTVLCHKKNTCTGFWLKIH